MGGQKSNRVLFALKQGYIIVASVDPRFDTKPLSLFPHGRISVENIGELLNNHNRKNDYVIICRPIQQCTQ